MDIEEIKETLKKAIDTWGEDAQINMISEEALELALAIRKFNRYGNQEKLDNLHDELADMTIMLMQASLMFDSDKVQEKIDYKMKKLKKILSSDSN